MCVEKSKLERWSVANWLFFFTDWVSEWHKVCLHMPHAPNVRLHLWVCKRPFSALSAFLQNEWSFFLVLGLGGLFSQFSEIGTRSGPKSSQVLLLLSRSRRADDFCAVFWSFSPIHAVNSKLKFTLPFHFPFSATSYILVNVSRPRFAIVSEERSRPS